MIGSWLDNFVIGSYSSIIGYHFCNRFFWHWPIFFFFKLTVLIVLILTLHNRHNFPTFFVQTIQIRTNYCDLQIQTMRPRQCWLPNLVSLSFIYSFFSFFFLNFLISNTDNYEVVASLEGISVSEFKQNPEKVFAEVIRSGKFVFATLRFVFLLGFYWCQLGKTSVITLLAKLNPSLLSKQLVDGMSALSIAVSVANRQSIETLLSLAEDKFDMLKTSQVVRTSRKKKKNFTII